MERTETQMPCFQLLSSGGQVTVAATPSPELLAMNSNSTQNLDTTRIKKTSVGCQMNYDRDLTVKEQLHFGYKTVFTTLTSWCFLFFYYYYYSFSNLMKITYSFYIMASFCGIQLTCRKKHHRRNIILLIYEFFSSASLLTTTSPNRRAAVCNTAFSHATTTAIQVQAQNKFVFMLPHRHNKHF